MNIDDIKKDLILYIGRNDKNLILANLKKLEKINALDKVKIINDQTEDSLLHRVCRYNKYELLKLFIDFGFDVNQKNLVR